MAQKHTPLGYDDTPYLPDGKWRVHDINRPQPAIVTPGTASTQCAPGQPPSDAVVLFDGTDLSGWRSSDGKPAQWLVKDGYMEVNGTGSIQSVVEFGDCQLHLEFASPAVVLGSSQGRGNSGVFLQGVYEIQVLDGYDNPTYADGTTAAIYGQYPPLVNANRKPGEWQVYDIFFQAARLQGDKVVEPAYITVMLNGVLMHHHQAIQGPTGHRTLSSYENGAPLKGPLGLQDHGGDKVRFRNIWLRHLKGYAGSELGGALCKRVRRPIPHLTAPHSSSDPWQDRARKAGNRSKKI